MNYVYIVLGTESSGRREIVNNLIRESRPNTGPTEPIAIYLPEELTDNAESAELLAIPNTEVIPLQQLESPSKNNPNEERLSYIITDGKRNPVDQLESIRQWIGRNNLELARIFTVVNCMFAVNNPQILPWYDACIHFSDVVFLNKRIDIPNQWINQFKGKYEKSRFPCFFEFVKKKGQVTNPPQILYPEARRISLYFDDLDNEVPPPIEITYESEDYSDDQDVQSPDNDPYIIRDPSGKRKKLIPDIAKILNNSTLP